MRLIPNLLIPVLVVFSSFSLAAQEAIVKGRVITLNEIPVVNARVYIQSSEETVFTNNEGNFTCKCNPKDKLFVTADGFRRAKLKLGKKNQRFVINMELSKKPLGAEIAVSSGHILQFEEFKLALNKYSTKPNYSKYKTVLDLLQSEFPTLKYVNGNIIIRGYRSLKGSNAALIEVDGNVMDNNALESLSPADIESVRIVKGSEAARYGYRGSNGVVCISTRNNNE